MAPGEMLTLHQIDDVHQIVNAGFFKPDRDSDAIPGFRTM